MHLRNLFTSSSKQPVEAGSARQLKSEKHKLRDAAMTGLCFLSSLVAFDAAINVLFPYPTDPLNVSPGSFNLYFDYGRSLEGKITRQIGPTDATSAPIVRAGWLDELPPPEEPEKPTAPNKHLMAMYGMSFTGNVGEAMAEMDSSLETRMVLGPAAPPNHSFAAYQQDRGQHQADVVVFGILASSIKALDAMSGMTWATDLPAAFTFPRYEMADGRLQEISPQVQSLQQLRQVRQNPQQWQAFVTQLQQHDRFFDAITFEQNWFDNSATLRMLRRAWAKGHQERVVQQIYTQDGFNPEWAQTPVLQAMVAEFAATAKADGKVPIVILFNDRGYEDHLYQMLHPTLDAKQIPYFSTHAVAPATDGTNFVGDGHFTEEANQKISAQVLSLVRQELKRLNPKASQVKQSARS